MKTKIKNYAFWTSISAAIVLFVNSFGGLFGFQIEEKIINDIIMSLCGILVVLGVVKMPTNISDNDLEVVDSFDVEQSASYNKSENISELKEIDNLKE